MTSSSTVKSPPRSCNRNLLIQLETERLKVEELELDCKRKDEQIARLTEERDLCKARIRSLNDLLTTMVEGEEYERMKNEFDGLKRNHEVIVSESKFYRKCAKDLEDEIKSVYEKDNELDNKIDCLLKDIEKLVQENLELGSLRAKYEDLCDRIKFMSEENDELRRSLEAFREQAHRELSAGSMAGSHSSIDTVVTGCGEPVSLLSELMQKDRDEELEKSRKLMETMKQEIEESRAKIMEIDRLKKENIAITAQKDLLLQQIKDIFCKEEPCSSREADRQRFGVSGQSIDLHQKIQNISLENEGLQSALDLAHECQNVLSSELLGMKKKYNDLLRAFRDLKDEMKQKSEPNLSAWPSSSGSYVPFSDSLVAELDSSLESEGYESGLSSFNARCHRRGAEETGSQSPDSVLFLSNNPSPRNPHRLMEPGSSRALRLSNKLKLVKQLEGSVTLNEWRDLAQPKIEAILVEPPVGIAHKAIVRRAEDKKKE